VGKEATTRIYDCRPFKSGSNETCTVEVKAPANISVLVRGYAATSAFDYEAKKL
jgi:leucyl aminopeptidase